MDGSDHGRSLIPKAVAAPVVVHGDSLEVLRGLPSESVHVVITDPPAGIGFMHSEAAGRTWDDFTGYQPCTAAGRNALRMLTSLASSDATCKALTSAVKRARSDARKAATGEAKRIATAVAKALAAALAEAREALRVEAGDLVDYVGLEPWAAGFVAFMVDIWTECMRVLKPGGQILAWALPRTADLAGLALRLAGYDLADNILHLFGQGRPHGLDIGKALGKSAAAEQPETWADWNTQLAPGHEQWLLARKPSPQTFAATALEHGTGALNIGACRIPRGEREARVRGTSSTDQVYGAGHSTSGIAVGLTDLGSWPPNALLSHSPDCGERCVDGCPVLELDRQSGQRRSGSGTVTRGSGQAVAFGKMGSVVQRLHGDRGGASRFFPQFRYQPKPRCRDIPGRSDLTITHTTYKHLDLMRWLVRLTASPGAVVLDPFAGSGTTGVACVAEGARFLGIELNADNVAQARARLAAAVGSPSAAVEANAAAPVGAQLGLV